MRIRVRSRIVRGQSGQALVETAIGLPLLLMLAFNVINLGYFWFMVMALSAAPRHAVQYASQGGPALSTSSAPSASAVQTVLLDNATNAIAGATTSNVAAQICVAASGTVTCTTNASGPSFTFPSLPTDPESPYFNLQRVSVAYTVTPLINGTAFNVLVPSNLTFFRQVSMRNLW